MSGFLEILTVSFIPVVISTVTSLISSVYIHRTIQENFKRRFARNMFFSRGYRKVRIQLKSGRKDICFVSIHDIKRIEDPEKASAMTVLHGEDYNYETDQFIEKAYIIEEIESVTDISGNEFSYIVLD